ncbi:hypothetical protein EX461_24315 [Vibrio parahaemolyticus]|nr:hypothetical protein [Vibrio parahaemolyticus]
MSKKGSVNKKQKSELYACVNFEKHLIKLASILENGRQKRVATARNGNVFHYYGKPTDKVKRDIGVTEPRNFLSETFTEHETLMLNTFKTELINSIAKQAKSYERKIKKEQKKINV